MLMSSLVDILVLGSIYTLFALGLTLAWGVLNVLNMAHGAIFMFGAFSAWILTQHAGALSLWVLTPLAMVVGGLVAIVLEIVAYRPIRRRSEVAQQRDLSTLIASIGFAAIPVAIAANMQTSAAVGLPAKSAKVRVFEIFGTRITDIQIVIMILAIVLTVVLMLVVRRTQLGRAMRAIAFQPEVAEIVGVPVSRIFFATMFVSGALAGLAGILWAVDTNGISATSGDNLLIKGFAIVVLAGVGSVGGALLAGFILAAAETGAVLWIDGGGGLRDAIAFVLIIALLLFKPQGLFARSVGERV